MSSNENADKVLHKWEENLSLSVPRAGHIAKLTGPRIDELQDTASNNSVYQPNIPPAPANILIVKTGSMAVEMRSFVYFPFHPQLTVSVFDAFVLSPSVGPSFCLINDPEAISGCY